jgi:hypothetical protein
MTDYPPPLYDHALNQDELDRMLLWRQQRDQRFQYRARVQASLAGNPYAARAVQDAWQPLLDHKIDMSLPRLPDDPETIPPSNQNLNS